jgi:hypothetical protein
VWSKLYYIGRIAGRPHVSVLEPAGDTKDAYVGECSIGTAPHRAEAARPLMLTLPHGGSRRAILRCLDCETQREVMVYLSEEKARKMVDHLIEGR